MSQNQVVPSGFLTKFVDFKVNIWVILTFCGAVMGSGLMWWVKGEKTSEQVVALQTQIAAFSNQVAKQAQESQQEARQLKEEIIRGNTAATTFRGDLALLTFRIQTMEDDMRILKNRKSKESQ